MTTNDLDDIARHFDIQSKRMTPRYLVGLVVMDRWLNQRRIERLGESGFAYLDDGEMAFLHVPFNPSSPVRVE